LQIALANAKHLSPELHKAVNEVYMLYKTEDHNFPSTNRTILNMQL